MNNTPFYRAEVFNELPLSARFKDESGAPIKWKIKVFNSVNFNRFRNDGDTDMIVLRRFCANSIIYPDLTDPKLQSNYNVDNAEDLLAAMLLPGEYFKLACYLQSLYVNSDTLFDEIMLMILELLARIQKLDNESEGEI